MRITVTFSGQTKTVEKFGLATLVSFERQYGIPASSISDETAVRIEWLAFLVYDALRRRSEVEGSFDTFLDEIEQIEFDQDEDAEEDPTREGL